MLFYCLYPSWFFVQYYFLRFIYLNIIYMLYYAFSHLVMSNSLQPQWTIAPQAALSMAFLLWVGHFLLKGIFPTQRSNLCLLHYRMNFFFTAEPPGKRYMLYNIFKFHGHKCYKINIYFLLCSTVWVCHSLYSGWGLRSFSVLETLLQLKVSYLCMYMWKILFGCTVYCSSMLMFKLIKI